MKRLRSVPINIAVHQIEPQRVRVKARTGPTAVMLSEWRDPDDDNPRNRTAREIKGYRTYCPLRRMLRQHGTQVTERHIYAADKLRIAVDTAAIGLSGLREMLPLLVAYGPRLAPPKFELRRAAAWREAMRALGCFTAGQRRMLTEIVLCNRSLAMWCDIVDAPEPKIEMGRLLTILDVLEAHYAAEIDEALARGQVLAA